MLQLLANAHVFAPEDLGIRQVLIGNGRVLGFLNDPDDVSVPGLFVTDLAGQRVLPGLIDGHAHITGGGGESGFSSRVPPVPLSQFTSAGVSTVVGVLGTDDTTRDTRSLVATAYALREQGLSAWCHTGGYHVPPVTLTGSVRDDIVFIDPVIGVGELAVSDHRSSQPTLDELLRIASDVHVAGLITGKAGILHLHLGDGARGLAVIRKALSQTELPARVFNPTHVNRRRALFSEAIELASNGVVIDVTAFPVDDADDAIPAHEALMQYLGSAAPRGNITISSDGGGCLPVFNEDGEIVQMETGSPASLALTLKTLLDGGAKLADVAPAFTSNPARLLRLHRKGGLQPGKDADLIVLNDNNGIADVMLAGKWHVRHGQQLLFGKFEKEFSD
ncbi:MAG TPA: beta-aspartyl-peptidase [Woeseiaceae bacterium]|nr:beta-aspartyl-peptidase [Woeseiaceae bacterium]